MAAAPRHDFAALLDELLAEEETDDTSVPTVSLDYISVVEELHSGRIHFAEDKVRAEYDAAAGPLPAPEKRLTVEPPSIDPPSIDPQEIARELGLDAARLPPDLDRVRRDFAFRNHPDRVAQDLRDRAMQRMQIANMLIDEAKRAALSARKSKSIFRGRRS